MLFHLEQIKLLNLACAHTQTLFRSKSYEKKNRTTITHHVQHTQALKHHEIEKEKQPDEWEMI